MHATLVELLENLKPGLLWVGRDGAVRYANGDASQRTGLVPGRRLYDPDLARAVTGAVAAKAPHEVRAYGVPAQQGGPVPELQCRVVPGLSADDAFVLIAAEPPVDHGAAFENLMEVIRSDVQLPLQQLTAAQGAADDQTWRAALDGLLQTVSKLVDLANVWGSSALLANDRIELRPLMQQIWQELAPLADSLGVTVRFATNASAEALAPLYGSEPWLKRVFLECLESALRASRRGARLDIEHRQMGPRALIVFRDSGVFAPGRGATVPLVATGGKPGAGKSAARLSGRDQIGLKLCQHIVNLHGGLLREEVEDGVRNFLIDLPTGAPHRTAGDQQMDIAQAQQYARDLAALMARARKAQPDGGRQAP